MDIYPLIEDTEFNNKLLSNPEFKFYKYDTPEYLSNREQMKELSDQICSSIGGYIYKQIQLFVSSYISLNTPYNGLLLYHGVGVGKTCTSLLIADNFKDYVKKNKKKIIILTKPAIQDSFKDEIFNHNDFTDNIDQNMFKCLSKEFQDDWIDFKNNNDSSKYNSFSESIINEYFEIYGYQQFVNIFKKQTLNSDGTYNSFKINSLFSDTVLIIDEIHNLRDDTEDSEISKNDSTKDSKEFIYNIISILKDPIKLILLSATPMYDKYDEIQFIINLLLLNDKKPHITEDIFRLYLNESDADKKNKYKQNIMNFTKGYISYIKGNDPLLFPKILYPDDSVNIFFDDPDNSFNILINEMKYPQKDFCIQMNYKNPTENQKITNTIFPLKQTNNSLIKENIFNFNELFDYIKKNDSYIINKSNESFALDYLNNLDKYSIKLHHLLQNINNPDTIGKIFIYSSFVDQNAGGGKLIALLLEYLGYQRKIYKKNELITSNYFNNNSINRNNKFYIRIDGSVSDVERDFYVKKFNSLDNTNGENIQIIIGSTNLFEGVTLLSIREIHILEPWYNKSRYEQIIGRGTRQCSHKHLPFENRNLTIYNYIASTDSNNFQLKSPKKYKIISNTNNDIDLRKIEIANQKQYEILQIESILQYNSIDCLLNKNINNITYNTLDETINLEDDISVIQMINSKNKSKLIKFSNSEFKCSVDSIDTNENIIRENIYINNKLIQNIKYYIKIIFNKSNQLYFDFNTIKTLLKENFFPHCLKKYNNNTCNFTNDNIIKLALQDLILNKEIIYNKFNVSGYLVINGNYYMFNSFNNKNNNLPLEFISFPFKNRLTHLFNFHNYSITPTFFENIEEPTIINTTKTTTSNIDTKDPNNVFKTFNVIPLKQHIDSILEQCYISSFFNILQDNDISLLYRYLWTSFNPDSGKNNPDLNSIINNTKLLDSTNISIEKYKTEAYIDSFGLNIFDIPNFSNNLDKYNNFSNDNFIQFLEQYYQANYDIFFIFNFHFIILTSLKCLFHKIFIQNIPISELNIYETNLYNNYKYLILNNNPLTFKFLDYSKDNLNNYDYIDIQYIIIEYNNTTNTWKEYNNKFSNNQQKIIVKTSSNTYDIYKITSNLKDARSLLIQKKFFNEQFINFDNTNFNDFDSIYNSFNYNNYTSYKNSYFKYCGSPVDSSKNFISPINIFNNISVPNIVKFSNIMGHINFRQTDSKLNLSPLSRTIFNLSIIYSINKDNNNIYFKGTHNSSFKTFLGDLSENQQILHIIYCIIDQIYEFNKLIIYETILENTNIYNTIWNQLIDSIPAKYTLDNFIDFDFKNNTFVFSDDNYNQLKLFMNQHFSIIISSKSTLLDNLNLIKNKLFNYNNILIILQQIFDNDNIPKNKSKIFKGGAITKKWINFYTASSDKNKYTKEFYITKLYTIILYHLDKIKFYNKRWLFNLFESSLINNALLDITAKPVSQYNKGKKTRIADSGSIPNANTYIQSKTMKNRSIKLIQNDSS